MQAAEENWKQGRVETGREELLEMKEHSIFH